MSSDTSTWYDERGHAMQVPPPPPFSPPTYAEPITYTIPAPPLNVAPVTSAPRTITLPNVQVRYVVGVVALVIAGLIGSQFGRGTSHKPSSPLTRSVSDADSNSAAYHAGYTAGFNAINETVDEGTSIDVLVASIGDIWQFCTQSVAPTALAGSNDGISGCVMGTKDGIDAVESAEAGLSS